MPFPTGEDSNIIESEQAQTVNLEQQKTTGSNSNVIQIIEAFDLGTLQMGPKQPKLHQFPYSPFPGKTKLRAFNADYYDRFPDFEYSVQKDAVFCFACRMFPSNNYAAGDKLTKIGERNWKK